MTIEVHVDAVVASTRKVPGTTNDKCAWLRMDAARRDLPRTVGQRKLQLFFYYLVEAVRLSFTTRLCVVLKVGRRI